MGFLGGLNFVNLCESGLPLPFTLCLLKIIEANFSDAIRTIILMYQCGNAETKVVYLNTKINLTNISQGQAYWCMNANMKEIIISFTAVFHIVFIQYFINLYAGVTYYICNYILEFTIYLP